jgi:hypothetical protein
LHWQLRIVEGPDKRDSEEVRGRWLPKTPLRTTGLNFLATLGEEIQLRTCVMNRALREFVWVGAEPMSKRSGYQTAGTRRQRVVPL